MGKENCWDAKKCQRQPGGTKTGELGICPVATEARVDGTNGGKNAGRTCWAVAGSLCGGEIQGSYAVKMANCRECEFYKAVNAEEGSGIEKASAVIAKLM